MTTLDEKQIYENRRDCLLAKELGLPVFIDLSSFDFIANKHKALPYSFAKENQVLPLEEKSGAIIVAFSDPSNMQLISQVRFLLKKKIVEVFSPIEKIEQAIELCYHQKAEEPSKYFQDLNSSPIESDAGETQEGYDLLVQSEDVPVIRMLNMMLMEAISQGASDIHFEPTESELRVRYRIDGVLQSRHTPPKEFQKELITRIKVISKLDIAEHRLPQDGRLKLHMGGRSIDFRVSTIPTVYGERIVLRILDKSSVVLGLDNIGLEKQILQDFRKFIHQSQGIVLVTGPTGSGKTTTLYSALSELNAPSVNIMTVEDPVEYKLPGMAQIGVNPKIDLTFSKGLRHILRQDPDVIMIGEIRDKETAQIAIQASLTGHLVLSTLHTNDAPSSLTRLVDMGVEPYLLTSSVLAVVAQRLVRKICPSCHEAYTPSDGELYDLGITRDDLVDGVLYKGKGCMECFNLGYKGRAGVYELMEMNLNIKNQLLQSADASKLQKVAMDSQMRSLRQMGAELAIKGVTTSFEVIRVTKQVE